MSQVKFIETLKLLGFPGVNKYSPTDFDLYFDDPTLVPFLEYFCTLDENNVLTTEELDEFASIPPEEMKELEKLAASEAEFLKEEKEIEKEEVIEFLGERLNHLERKFISLGEQKKLLLEHKAALLKEKTEHETTNRKLRKIYDDFSMNKVPQAKAQLLTSLDSFSELILNLKDLANISDDENKILPLLNLKDVEEYFQEEEQLNNVIISYIENNVQFKDECKTKLNVPGPSTEEIYKEILILRKSLKSAKIGESMSTCNSIKAEKSLKLIKDIETGSFDDVLEMSAIQLNNKFNEELERYESLQQQEALLVSNLTYAVSEHVEARCREVAIAHTNETCLVYRNNLEKIMMPVELMQNQKARLELLLLFATIHKKHWHDVKDLIDRVSCFIISEKESRLQTMEKIEKSMKLTNPEEPHLSPDSLLYSVYKVLNDVDHEEQPLIHLSEVVKSIEKLSEENNHCLKVREENIDVLRKLKKHYLSVEKRVSKGVDYDKLMRLEKTFNTKINQVEVLLQHIQNHLMEHEDDWNKKNKLIESNRSMKIARKLFIYALLNWDGFEQKIEEVIDAVNFNQDYQM